MSAPRVDLEQWALSPDGSPSPALQHLITELLGQDVAGVEVIRRGSNLVLKDSAETTVFRVQHVDRARNIAENLMLVASLAAAGAPVVAALSTETAQDDDVVLTAWPMGRPAATTDQRALGTTLKALHGIAPLASLGPVDITSRFQQRLDALDPDVPAAIVSALSEHAEHAVTILESAKKRDRVLLHGDGHIGNLVWLQEEARLIDLDDLCVGPLEFDLAPSLVSYHRFHRDDRLWAEFQEGYGNGPDWELAHRLMLVREATMNTWLASLWAHSSAAQHELVHRVETWDKDWRGHEPWRPI